VILGQYRPASAFIPASTWKIATAALAIHTLGLDYHFPTFFYQGRQGRLFIRGRGDPFLTSEEIARLVKRLKKKLTMPVSAIIIDNSSFRLTGRPDGSTMTLNPYDADLSALAVNFNTINLQVTDKVRSAERQTPNLPIMAGLGQKLSIGRHRIALHKIKNINDYSGQLLAALGGLTGGAAVCPIRRGKVPGGLTAIYIHRNSRNLKAVLKALFLYSNNFIANQIFLACGARRFGWPATWEKARRAMREFMALTVKLPKGACEVMEGSGLSRHNRITPAAMLQLLTYFEPQADLLPLHYGQRLKSGTLTGVYAYAGYLGAGKSPDPFVLILNQANNVRDRVVRLLIGAYNQESGVGAGFKPAHREVTGA